MANLITHSLTFSKESVQEFFLKPLFVENDIRDIVTVRTDIKTSEKLDLIDSLEKITKAYAQGTSFTASTGVTITQRTLTVADMKGEVKQNGKAFKNWVKQELLKKGWQENDIQGTIFEEIVMSVFMRGLARDLQRQIFFGDQNKELSTDSVTNGNADTNYNVYNGFWKLIIKAFDDGDIAAGQKVDANVTAYQTQVAVKEKDTITLTGTSGTANITSNGVAYLATFATDLTTTAANFVTSHSAALALRGIVVTSSGADVILEAKAPGFALTSSIANVSGNLAGTKADTTANVKNTTLKTDAASSIMAAMIAAAPNELLEGDGQIFVVTRSMWENYKATLRALNGSEAAFQMTLNGRPTLSYDGYPIVVRREWDGIISNDFNGVRPHRALFVRPENLVVGVDGNADDVNVEVVYDAVTQENIFRVEYKAGTQYVHGKYIVAAY